MSKTDLDTLEGWLAHGAAKGWVTLPFCGTHDGVPMMKAEWKALAQGYDPCVPMMRVWGETDTDDQIWQLLKELDDDEA